MHCKMVYMIHTILPCRTVPQAAPLLTSGAVEGTLEQTVTSDFVGAEKQIVDTIIDFNIVSDVHWQEWPLCTEELPQPSAMQFRRS